MFIDTPGIHKSKSRLNRGMVDVAMSAISGVDLLLLVVDASAPVEDAFVSEVLKGVKTPVVLVLNKIDLVKDKGRVLEKIAAYSRLHPFREVVPISAGTGNGVERLVTAITAYIPEGPALFPEDILTDMSERFICAEMIREKVFRMTQKEIPYSTAVEVEAFTEREDGLISISASIILERETQKGIVIGKRGEMLKRIGTQARHDIERLLGTKVFLELFVKVVDNWSERTSKLREFGYE